MFNKIKLYIKNKLLDWLGIKKVNTGFMFDKELILNDGSSIIAWI